MTALRPELEQTLALVGRPPDAWSEADRAAAAERLADLLLRPGDLADYAARLAGPPHHLVPFLGSFTNPDLAHDLVSPDDVARILDGGPAVFRSWPAARLRPLLRNPAELHELADFVHDTLPDAWRPRLLADARRLAPVPPPSPPAAVVVKARPATRVRPWAVALAASVLLNVAVGYYAFRGSSAGNGAGRPTVVAELGKAAGRGPADPWAVRVGADAKGFATVVLLRPGKTPQVVPPPGENLLAVGPGEQGEWLLEADDLGPDHFALTIVTRQPANLLLNGKLKTAFDPAQRDAIQQQAAKILTDHGFDAPVFQWVPLRP